jgi:CRP/FNR family cyclic AMP-dependent transcriptional regulator
MTDPLALRFGREYAAGDVLFREGDPGAEMYVIQSGRIELLKKVGARERTLATLGRGEFLGEMAILNGKPRTATAIVREPTRCLVLDGATLEQMIIHSPEIAVLLVRKLAQRLDSAGEMIQMLLTPDPQARVLLGLKRHAESFGEGPQTGATETGPRATGAGTGVTSVRVRLSTEGLALEVGTDVARTRDVLGRLRRLGIVTEDPNGTEMTLDLARLLEFMEFLENPRQRGA